MNFQLFNEKEKKKSGGALFRDKGVKGDATAELTVGLGFVDIFVRKDFNTYFKDNTFDNRKMIQFGINLGL